MAKTLYLYSTLASSQLYTGYKKGGADLPLVEWEIHVKGGANIAGKHLITPLGVVTKIDADDYALLKTNAVFQAHEENGYILVREREVDPEVAAADLEGRDVSAPLVEADFAQTDAKPAEPASIDAPAVAPRSRRA